MPQNYLKRILDARIYDLAIETPLDPMPLISARIKNNVLLKREDLQPVFSFKIRGAYNRLRNLTEEEKKQGVVTASAGNHAQGLALAARHLNIKAIIVMPRTTPAIKVDAVKRRGAKVVLMGDAFDQAAAHAQQLVEEKGMIYVPPFDDEYVIAGQGTVGMEILRQHPQHIDVVFVPVGGGGLCAGVAAYIKTVRPDTKVIAVEAEDSACLKAAMEKNRRVVLPQVGIFADGVAVAQIGKETFRVIKETIDEVITVNTDEMCAAIKDIFEDTRSIAEPSGALALAGAKKYAQMHDLSDKTFVAIDSGANTNFDRLRYISERTEIGEQREAIFAVTIPETPGSYRKFIKVLGRRAITEFNYRYSGAKSAHIFVGMQVAPASNDRQEIMESLQNAGYRVVDMTDNELAKLHARYMVGGHPPNIENEVVYRFTFPERPGALLDFLTKTAVGNWNITMFHYRNHGSAYGRVLAGLQIPKEDRKKFKATLDELNYQYTDESDNPAYTFFLGSL